MRWMSAVAEAALSRKMIPGALGHWRRHFAQGAVRAERGVDGGLAKHSLCAP